MVRWCVKNIKIIVAENEKNINRNVWLKTKNTDLAELQMVRQFLLNFVFNSWVSNAMNILFYFNANAENISNSRVLTLLVKNALLSVNMFFLKRVQYLFKWNVWRTIHTLSWDSESWFNSNVMEGCPFLPIEVEK